MSLFEDLIKKVEEKNLSKDQLNEYYDDLSFLKVKMLSEIARVKKEKALFLLSSEGKSAVDKKINWEGSQSGLKEIDLKHQISSISTLLSSLKNRLYTTY